MEADCPTVGEKLSNVGYDVLQIVAVFGTAVVAFVMGRMVERAFCPQNTVCCGLMNSRGANTGGAVEMEELDDGL